MKLNKLLLSIFALSTLAFVGCEDEVASNNDLNGEHVSFMKQPQPIEIEVGESMVIEASVFASKATNTDRVIELEAVYTSVHNDAMETTTVPVTTVAPEHFTIPASVTIPAGQKTGTFEVNVTNIDLGPQGKRIVIQMKPQDGVQTPNYFLGTFNDNNYETFSERLILTVRDGCPKNPFRVEITTDAFGSETTWELYDGTMTLIGQGGPYPDQSAIGAYPQPPHIFCLEDGNYTFYIYDEPYNDGMDAGYGNGFYRLVKVVDGEDVEIAKNGVFGAFEEVTFSLP